MSGEAEEEVNEDDVVETSDSETGGTLKETLCINDEHAATTKKLDEKRKQTEKVEAMIAYVDKKRAKRMQELSHTRNAYPDKVKFMSISCLQFFSFLLSSHILKI